MAAPTIPKKPITMRKGAYRPLRLLLITAVSIFLAEGAIMRVIEAFSLPPSFYVSMLDAAVLTVVVFPALYFFSYRPMVRQISERTQLQQHMAVSERQAAVGLLASGVAHEINNPLNSILGLAQVLLKEGGLCDAQRRDLAVIEEQAKRGGRITQGLLNFSRKTRPSKEVFSIAELMERTLPLVEHDLFEAGILFEKKYVEPPPWLHADPDQLEQVLINLIINAKQALTSSLEKKITLTVEAASGRVLIHIRDTGCGIAKENLESIFDPFFTTKPVGVGTGLGLSISYGIASEHGGTIRVSSVVGRGSTFTIELPEYVPSRPS